VINIVEAAFLAHEKGKDVLPPKLFLDMRPFGYNCDGDVMPAYVDSDKVCGVKWIGGSIDNYKLNLPYLFSIIILNDPKTFIPMAIISGNLLTGMRTGAATAVAVKYLTNKNSSNVFIVGAGFQSKYQLLALREVLKIEKVKVFDIRKSVQEKFIKDMNENADLEIEGV
ncbi:MAG: ornithine cyclodeaminase family protein, partial [Candidatus Bathyarchaeia archaeon]